MALAITVDASSDNSFGGGLPNGLGRGGGGGGGGRPGAGALVAGGSHTNLVGLAVVQAREGEAQGAGVPVIVGVPDVAGAVAVGVVAVGDLIVLDVGVVLGRGSPGDGDLAVAGAQRRGRGGVGSAGGA